MVAGMGWMGLKKINSTYINVSIKKQNLSFFDKGILMQRFSISTAKRGVGQQKDSFKTPLGKHIVSCLLYTSPSPRDGLLSRMPSSA